MISVRSIESRDEWLVWRKEVLTASDIGAVAGGDPYKTPLRVYAEKMTDVAVEESPIMRRGRMFEHAAYGYLLEDHPTWTWWRPNAFYADPDLKLGATPDALARDDDGLLVNCQIKTVSLPTFLDWQGIPPHSYVLQTACENLLTKADYGILAVMVVSAYGADMHEFPVPRHPGAEKRICDLARQFWANIKKGLVPRPVYRLDAEVVEAMHPPSDIAEPVDLSGDNRLMEVLELRETLKESMKRGKEDLAALDAEIVHKLDGAQLATLPGWKITHRMQHRNGYTVRETDYAALNVYKQEGRQ